MIIMEVNSSNNVTMEISEMENKTLNIGEVIEIPKSLNYEDLENKPTLDDIPIVGDMHERDPTVPNWAKQITRPVYTAEDVGAIGKNDVQELTVDVLENMWNSI